MAHSSHPQVPAMTSLLLSCLFQSLTLATLPTTVCRVSRCLKVTLPSVCHILSVWPTEFLGTTPREQRSFSGHSGPCYLLSRQKTTIIRNKKGAGWRRPLIPHSGGRSRWVSVRSRWYLDPDIWLSSPKTRNKGGKCYLWKATYQPW